MKAWQKTVFYAIIILGVSALWFLGIYAPQRTGRLAAKASMYMDQFRPKAEEIDSKFNHRDMVVNGIKWHYVDEGPRDGKVVLFMHGLPEGWYSWCYTIPLIDRRYRCIAIDMKGYGRSDKEDENYDWHAVAKETLELLGSLGVEKFYVVGHDWGSLISSVMVSDHPQQILGYVRMQADLIRGGMLRAMARKPQFLLFQSNWLATFMMRDAEWFIDQVYPPRMLKSFNPIDRAYFIYEFSRPKVAEQVPKYFQLRNWDLDAGLTKICKNRFPFPVLILQADSDPAQPATSFADVSSECPHVELKWIKGASHFSNLDQPEQVAEAINEFLRRCERSSAKLGGVG
jgi:pimeloyl-ACP methyl ester carboxylesterase